MKHCQFKNHCTLVDMLGNAPIGCWRPLGQGLMGTGDPLGNAQVVLETLWATLSE
jgi:hypothetical protein